jgi:uncharacterized protein (TIGR00661 family)
VKILYGVQGTGNGHLSRARAMQRYLNNKNIDTTYLFSGRERDDYFDMEVFGEFEVKQGLTFAIKNGRVNYLKTAMKNNPLTFIKEVKNLDLDHYDLVLCDFEPVTAWASKLRKKPIIGFGHQPAFNHKIPFEGRNPVAQAVMKYFAPTDISIGLHWHHFNQPLLPPIIYVDDACDAEIQKNKVLVYLPFDDETVIETLLSRFPAYEFYIYHPEYKQEIEKRNIHKCPLSVHNFHYDLKTSDAVICGAGFELPSECIHFGKKVLVKPVKNQMEQESNAAALEQLGLGKCMKELNARVIGDWLATPNTNGNKHYPDVAKALVDWIIAGEWQDFSKLQRDLWASVS